MAASMTGGPRRSGSGKGLSEEDEEALFELMAQAAYGGEDRDDIVFTGKFLASIFRAYSEHLIKIMRDWPGLSDALQSKDAIERARRLHERLRESATVRPLVDSRGRSLRVIPDLQEQVTRSLISGKGMEI